MSGVERCVSSSILPDSTFVVRFRREWSAAGPRWPGWVEHVQSGEDTAFLDLDEMLRFIRRFGAMADAVAGFWQPPVAP
jgi:hypothetical protein